jgi:predicted nucleic acid-binding protein
MPAAVADTSVLVAFSGVGRLDILRHRYGEITVPRAVFDEVVIDGEGWIEAADVQAALRRGGWIKIKDVSAAIPIPFPPRLGAGEREAILLARRLDLTLLADDRLARRIAAANGVVLEGTLAILASAKQAHLIPSTKPIVLAMVANGIRFGEELLASFFRTMNE